MHKFDVKYTFDNYYEYYKYTLIKSRILKDSIFCIVFFAFAAYIFIDKSADRDIENSKPKVPEKKQKDNSMEKLADIFKNKVSCYIPACRLLSVGSSINKEVFIKRIVL